MTGDELRDARDDAYVMTPLDHLMAEMYWATRYPKEYLELLSKINTGNYTVLKPDSQGG